MPDREAQRSGLAVFWGMGLGMVGRSPVQRTEPERPYPPVVAQNQ